jgi:hypothetical protein
MTDITFGFCFYSLFSLIITIFALLFIINFFSFCSLQAEATEEESNDAEEESITEADSDIIEWSSTKYRFPSVDSDSVEWSSTKYKMASD